MFRIGIFTHFSLTEGCSVMNLKLYPFATLSTQTLHLILISLALTHMHTADDIDGAFVMILLLRLLKSCS